MSEFRIDKITNREGTSGTQIAGITTFSGTFGMQIPVGPTEMRSGRGRGVFMGGVTPTVVNTMDYITIATTGNALDFGDLGAVKRQSGGMASSTRGLSTGGGPSPALTKRIDYVTMSSQGGASDFGDLLVAKAYMANANSSTRGLILGAWSPKTADIEYVTFATTGDASDFGGILTMPRQAEGTVSSPTRGLAGGGESMAPFNDSPFATRVIDYVTIASRGVNAQDFGELTQSSWGILGGSNSIRGIWAGGNPSRRPSAIMDYVTIATLGNAIDFGDQSVGRSYGGIAFSQTRGCFGGGTQSPVTPAILDVIDYVTIATTGNAQGFGDLTVARSGNSGCSDSNGGLG